MKKIVHVAAAVITRPDGSFLLGQRAPDTFYPGYWEFPGGKVEPGETPRDALIRELDEELGMKVEVALPWITREHEYEHAHVSLHFFEVPAWRGDIHDKVHSALAWQHADAMDVGPMLPANGPILKALRLPRTMGITHAAEAGVNAQLAQLDEGVARRLLDGLEPRPCGGGVAVEHDAGRTGLHAHRRHVVRDDVVQVAGDAEPLLAHAPRRLRLSGRLRVIGPGHDLRDVGAPVADRVGQEIATVSRRTAPATYHPCSRGR